MAKQNTSEYIAPTVTVEGSLHDLTLIINKHSTNTPDGYAFNGVVLTS